MNRIKEKSFVVALLCLLTFVLPLAGQGNQAGAFILISQQGSVSYEQADGTPAQAIAVGKPIPLSYTITTGQGGQLVGLLSNGTLLTLDEDTRMKVGTFKQEPFDAGGKKLADLPGEPSKSEVGIDLDFGSLVVKTKKLNKGSAFDINSPVGVAGIRGTEFQMASRPGQGVQLDVTESTVAFTPPGGVPMPVTQGNGLSVSPSGVPTMRPVNPTVARKIETTNQTATEATQEVSLGEVAVAMEQSGKEQETVEEAPLEDVPEEEPAETEDTSTQESEPAESQEQDKEETAPAEDPVLEEQESAPVDEPVEEAVPSEEPTLAPEEPKEERAEQPAPAVEEEKVLELPTEEPLPELPADPLEEELLIFSPEAMEDPLVAEDPLFALPEGLEESEGDRLKRLSKANEEEGGVFRAEQADEPLVRTNEEPSRSAPKSPGKAGGEGVGQPGPGNKPAEPVSAVSANSPSTPASEPNLPSTPGSTPQSPTKAPEVPKKAAPTPPPAKNLPDVNKIVQENDPGITQERELAKHGLSDAQKAQFDALSPITKAKVKELETPVVQRLTENKGLSDAETSAFLELGDQARELVLGLEDSVMTTLLQQDIDEVLLVESLSKMNMDFPTPADVPTFEPVFSVDVSLQELSQKLRDSGNGWVMDELYELSGGELTQDWLKRGEEALSLLKDYRLEEMSPADAMSAERALSNPFYLEISALFEELALEELVTGDGSLLGGRHLIIESNSQALNPYFGEGVDELILSGSDNLEVLAGFEWDIPLEKNNARLVLMSGGDLSIAEGATLRSATSDLVIASRNHLALRGVELHGAREVSISGMRDVQLDNVHLQASTLAKIKARRDLDVNGLSFRQDISRIVMEASTMRLRNVTFPAAAQVRLNSSLGGIDGRYPNFGNVSAAQQIGRVNFIENVKSGTNLLNSRAAFDQHARNIQIGKIANP